jgi:probable DNA repair protein
MSQSLLAGALATGATVVTPNNRLAREIVLRFDRARLAEGKRAWTPADVLPWTMWLDRLRLAARPTGALPVLLDAAAVREMWHGTVAGHAAPLLNVRGAVRHAIDAWTVFHAWREAGESLERVAARGASEDAQSFEAWAERYRRRLDALDAVDHARLPDLLAARAASSWIQASGRTVLHGFIAFTPQQRRLIRALRAAGMPIDELPSDDEPAPLRFQAACATPSSELASALAFARARVISNPQARVAIVVADLEQRRDETLALAEEILCPQQLLALAPDAPRPYDISLGDPLASAPVIACALDFIALSVGDVEATVAASALRAPFLPEAAAYWRRRAAVERRWRDEGRRTVVWTDVLAALRRCDALLYTRFAGLQTISRVARLPRDWARAWTDWLAALGWPGSASLTSAQWQAHDAWSNALAKFASTGTITGPVSAAVALDSLRALLTDQIWAPESAPAQIQILGVLEAAGLSFDSAWLAGFDAHRWPPAAAPNPFLPLSWQRSRGVVRSDAASALSQARQLTKQLSALAREVVASHAERIDDAPSAMSPLFSHWPPFDRARRVATERLSEVIHAVELERVPDATAPRIPADGSLRGGAGLFESQSSCPFQAFARYRLRTDAWPEWPEGLSAIERGTVLHAVLKAFWDDVGDQATLLRMDAADLARRIEAAVDSGKAKLEPSRWRALPAAIANAETRRLAATLHAWVEEGERLRPPFRVRAHEQAIEFALEGITVRARIDRIDELDADALAVIDYKSGVVVRPLRWFAARPQGVQLAVYAHGLEALGVGPIRALAYAQVKAGEIGVSGLAEARSLWPALDVAGSDKSRLPVASFQEARAQMERGLVALAREIGEGVADVAPRDRASCQYCELKPLCRIRNLDDRSAAAEEPVGDE